MKQNIFESMTKALKEFDNQDDLELVVDTDIENAQPQEDEVVKPIVDPELGYESDLKGDIPEKTYIGKKVIDCHICGSAFFEDELTDDTICPVCTAGREDLEVVGVVCDADEAKDVAEPTAEEPTEPVADEKSEDKPAENKDEEKDKEEESFDFNEANMNTLIEKFLKENYADFKSYKTVSSVLTGNNKLKLTGIVETANGVTKTVVFLTERFNLMKEGTFKVKAACPAFSSTRSNTFIFEGKLSNKKIVFEKMVYKYIVKHNNESYQVSGRAVL